MSNHAATLISWPCKLFPRPLSWIAKKERFQFRLWLVHATGRLYRLDRGDGRKALKSMDELPPD